MRHFMTRWSVFTGNLMQRLATLTGQSALMLALLTPQAVQAVDQTLDERVSALEDLRISGSVRLNYTVQDWNDAQTDRGGDFRFNALTLGIDTQDRKSTRLNSSHV